MSHALTVERHDTRIGDAGGAADDQSRMMMRLAAQRIIRVTTNTMLVEQCLHRASATYIHPCAQPRRHRAEQRVD